MRDFHARCVKIMRFNDFWWSEVAVFGQKSSWYSPCYQGDRLSIEIDVNRIRSGSDQSAGCYENAFEADTYRPLF